MSSHLAVAGRNMQAIIDRQGSPPRGDLEQDHLDADEILCRALRMLGYRTLVDLFYRVEKWYA